MKRITWRVEKRKLADLKPHPKNPRQFTEKGMKDLENSINSIGFMQPININQDGLILSGHARTMKLKQMGETEVDVYVPDRMLTPKQEEEVLVRANANTAGQWDWDLLANNFEIEEINDWGLEVPDMNIEVEELEAKEDDFDGEPPAEPITVLGDLYEIGDHKLLCGDSTCSDAVAKLMNGELADMVFTDPPYNLLDHKIETGIDPILMFSNYLLFCKDNLFVVFFGQHPTILDFINGALSHKLKYVNEIIWNKKTASSCFPDVLRVHENMFIFKKGDIRYFETKVSFDDWLAEADYDKLASIKRELSEARVKNPNRFTNKKAKASDKYYASMDTETQLNPLGKDFKKICTVWNEFRDSFKHRGSGESLHATQKPVDLLARTLKLCSKENDLIIELFLGSGSTMVASHQLKRKCYGMELDPKYCDVIIRRMIKLDPSLKITRNGEDCKNEFTENNG